MLKRILIIFWVLCLIVGVKIIEKCLRTFCFIYFYLWLTCRLENCFTLASFQSVDSLYILFFILFWFHELIYQKIILFCKLIDLIHILYSQNILILLRFSDILFIFLVFSVPKRFLSQKILLIFHICVIVYCDIILMFWRMETSKKRILFVYFR
jgi:hypothetical protein